MTNCEGLKEIVGMICSICDEDTKDRSDLCKKHRRLIGGLMIERISKKII